MSKNELNYEQRLVKDDPKRLLCNKCKRYVHIDNYNYIIDTCVYCVAKQDGKKLTTKKRYYDRNSKRHV